MTTKVNTYCASATAKVNRGGTKKKSNASTFDDRGEHRGSASEQQRTPTTASMNSSTMLDRSNRCCNGNADERRRRGEPERPAVAPRRHRFGRRGRDVGRLGRRARASDEHHVEVGRESVHAERRARAPQIAQRPPRRRADPI